MPIHVIPVSPTPDALPFDQRTVLDGRPYILRFQWNERAACWYLTIAQDDGTPLLRGLAVRNNVPLLRPYRHDTRLPGGDIVAQTEVEPGRDAQREELGARVVLLYIDAAELA